MQSNTITVATQTGENSEDSEEELPNHILKKAVRIVDSFDCEIRRDGLHYMCDFLNNDLPIRIKILKDELHISLKKANKQDLKKQMFVKLAQYLDRKLGNIIKDLKADGQITHLLYAHWMRSLKRACGLTCFV